MTVIRSMQNKSSGKNMGKHDCRNWVYKDGSSFEVSWKCPYLGRRKRERCFKTLEEAVAYRNAAVPVALWWCKDRKQLASGDK